MPIRQQEFIVALPAAELSVELQPVHNAVHSLLLLARVEHLSGLGDWVVQTATEMTAVEHERHRLVMIGLHYAVLPRQSWSTFPAYLSHLEVMAPEALREKLLGSYARISLRADGEGHTMLDEPVPFASDEILESFDSFLAFLRARFSEEHVDEALERKAYGYLLDPPALHDLVVSHLRSMWDSYLASEWTQVRPLLRDAVEAFQQVDLAGMDRLQAAEFVTGQQLVENSSVCTKLEDAERLLFVPSAHVGPYLGTFSMGNALGIIFGARLPAGTHFHAPDLSRAEIVVRLNALADDTRLHILKLIVTEGELRSQEIMERLDLSQSAASRHLKQLSATGYLNERRCAGAKCYRLNQERIEESLQAVTQFLKPTS